MTSRFFEWGGGEVPASVRGFLTFRPVLRKIVVSDAQVIRLPGRRHLRRFFPRKDVPPRAGDKTNTAGSKEIEPAV